MIGEEVKSAVNLALSILPKAMDSIEARVMLFTIGLQESRFLYRYQVVNGRPELKGPARGFWQFERGTPQSRGGVCGVLLHSATSGHLKNLCDERGCEFASARIHAAIEHDDVLAAGLARLLLYTDPNPLPRLDEVQEAWCLYAERTWRPGKPKKDTWHAFHEEAVQALDRRRFIS